MTHAQLPDPLTSTDCDLRGLPYMPFEVQNILISDLVLLSTGDEFKAAMLLRAASWSRIPAASLPDEPRALAKLAGVDFCDWEKVKDRALHGWVKCSDGFLYHPDVADRAMNALPDHQVFQEKRSGDAARKRRERDDRRRLFEEASGLNLSVAFNTKTSDLRRLVADAMVTRDQRDKSRVTSHGEQRDQDRDRPHDMSRSEAVTGHEKVTARKGKGKEDSPQPPTGGDRDRFDEAWSVLHDKSRGPADMGMARTLWREFIASGEIDADGLFAATKAVSDVVFASGGKQPMKAFHRWLKLREWQNWAPTGGQPKSHWTGPDHIRDAIIAQVAKTRCSRKEGEAFAASWLDSVTTWSDVPAAIVCLATTVEKKLRTTVGKMLVDEFGVQVIVKAAGEAA
ncbi:DUF1376 domain-containing protein [Caulobacter sp. Root343]|uniref:DUF1376 domain-containing protein n=1 Tax=Caulobacter sp. Root343 TaxID=1736520 RepID=UPI0006FE7085|nr:DUF1376 domain-containing protein [Caulobacter sp. Root343]KQV66623.1 hypothetical protein ASC70_12380 [Caulobacter sp. Root343]